MDPMMISALIGLAGNMLNKQADKNAAPGQMLSSFQVPQVPGTQFAIPGMSGLKGGMAQQLLGGM